MKNEKKQITIKLVRSPADKLPKHKATIIGLGLRRMHQVVVLEDTPSIRGMIKKVSYLVEVLEKA